MAESSKLESSEKMITQKISVSDHTEISDSFVIDMETIVHGSTKDPTPNSRITLQRNLSKKGSQRGTEKKISSNLGTASDRDSIVASTTSSPRAVAGAGRPDSSTVAGVAAAEPGERVHQIVINAGNMGTTASTEGRAFVKRNSFRRPSSWGLDPRRILILFASLSIIGTMLLIYFTLSISRKADENGLELEEW